MGIEVVFMTFALKRHANRVRPAFEQRLYAQNPFDRYLAAPDCGTITSGESLFASDLELAPHRRSAFR